MKPFYKSKTFWFNAYTVAAYALKTFGVVDLPQLDPAAAAAVNIVLRAVTKQPLSVS